MELSTLTQELLQIIPAQTAATVVTELKILFIF